MINAKKIEIYRSKVQLLTADIREIINSSLPSAELSKRIMARLREEYIFAKNSYINTFKAATYVTIDPYSEDIKPELEDEDSEGNGDEQYCKIPAYSFGPFDSEAYFADDTFKILWLIKEPFCENRDELVEAYYKNDSDYYNQAKCYSIWENLEYNTHINIVKICQIILVELAKVELGKISDVTIKNSLLKLKKEDLDDKNQIMKHICILEINHFPGFAFNPNNKKKSNDGSIWKWAQINADLIKTLIAFYNPDVIIGGNTLGHFFPERYRLIGTGNDHSFEHIMKGIKNGEEIFKKLGLTNMKDERDNMKINNDYLFNTEEGIVLVDSSHPSRYSKVQSEENGKQIRAFIEEKKSRI